MRQQDSMVDTDGKVETRFSKDFSAVDVTEYDNFLAIGYSSCAFQERTAWPGLAVG